MSRQARARHLRARLSDRDLEVLELLRRFRLLSGEQLRRLCVPDGNRITQARKIRALLQRLAELKLVVRLSRRIGGLHAGSEGHIIGLSGLGHAVLDIGHDAPRRHRSVTDTKLAHQDHVLAVAQLHVELRERASRHVEVLTYDTEPDCWRRFGGLGGQGVMLKPDAFLRLGLDEYERTVFVELDLDTESLPTISRKCGVYTAYWRSGQEQQQHGVFPQVWWLVPDTSRLKAIARAIARQPADARQLFTVALINDAADQLTDLPGRGEV